MKYLCMYMNPLWNILFLNHIHIHILLSIVSDKIKTFILDIIVLKKNRKNTKKKKEKTYFLEYIGLIPVPVFDIFN